ncbi:hypothetical protein [Campylobacter suis]|uniref:Uncharacterized protein n=1 Tax=Campylobacter suis TaxID=2790657 RepID=A0ABM8Q3H2_9BACT|nr:hypothetical protein [Campylobacter suis]CAD7287373.1 hypothetical protein LMG8286_00957 [Campylobacter suis]
MRVGELYGVISLVLAKNFNSAPDITDAMKFRKSNSWLIQRDSEANVLGSRHFSKFLAGESVAIISDDFIHLGKFLRVSHYINGANEDLTKFYEACKFEPKFGEIDSLSNQLLLIASVLKKELDEQNGKFLIRFLTAYFLPYATIAAKDISQNAQSEFYKALGYFLDDFCVALCEMFGIKQK